MAKEKLFNDALRVAVLMQDRESGKTRLRLIADRLADEAVLGNIAAIKEVAERIDGKVPQAHVGDDDHDPIRIGGVTVSFVDPKG
jgi:hypothetical protein